MVQDVIRTSFLTLNIILGSTYLTLSVADGNHFCKSLSCLTSAGLLTPHESRNFVFS